MQNQFGQASRGKVQKFRLGNLYKWLSYQKSRMVLKLNLGCGNDIREGFINVDIEEHKGVNLICDLDKLPLPFADNSVDYILCSHLLEHLSNRIEFMLELHRVCKKGAIIDFRVPHFSNFTSHSDLTHVRPGFSYFSFGAPWTNKVLYDKFKVKKRLNFTRANYVWLNYIFNPIINLWPTLYERLFCYLLPCSEIHFKLEVIK